MAAPPAALEVLDVRYRADRAFPHFERFWHDKPGLPGQLEAIAAPADGVESAELGASLHVYLRNRSAAAVAVRDITLGGVSLKKALVYSDQRIRKKFASIYFANLPQAQLDTLLACGEPIWWKVDPSPIPPGGVAEVIVRLRHTPRTRPVPLAILTEKQTVPVKVQPTLGQPRIRSISFSPKLDRVYLFVEARPGTAPRQILFNGEDVTARASIAADPKLALTPVTLTLTEPLVKGSFHVLQVHLADGSRVSAGARAWAEPLVYGMFGGPGGRGENVALARSYVDDLARHHINVQMPQIGSPAVVSFFKSDAGRAYCRARDLRMILMNPGTWGVRDPLMFYVHDEPDCGDFRMEGVPEHKKIGGMAQWCIEHAGELRAAAPDVPHMINLNGTYKPHNWYIYGQLADVFASDPYYQTRLSNAYLKNPERIPLYTKATYLYAVASAAESACWPRPLHIILNAVAHTDEQTGRTFRTATPQEKRIELYYALAAGAKGFSYWWYTPHGKSSGLGTAHRGDERAAALWSEIGRLGAEVRTAGPLVVRSCPIEVPVAASSRALWTRTLASDDALILVAVNDQYHNDEHGTTFEPLANVSARVTLPAWLEPAAVFEVTADGVRDVPARRSGRELALELGRVELTRLIVIARDPGLRTQLAQLYRTRFAGSTLSMEDAR